VIVRDARERDWPALWPIVCEIVVAVDPFTYDPTMTE
jgi:hypothetical protein